MKRKKDKKSKKRSKKTRRESESSGSEDEWVEAPSQVPAPPVTADTPPKAKRDDWMLGGDDLFGGLGREKRKRNPDELGDSDLPEKELQERQKKVC